MDKETLGIVTVTPVYETEEETKPLDEVDLSTSTEDEE